MNDPQNEKKYEFAYKITCKGSLPNTKWFSKELRHLEEQFREYLDDLEKELCDFGSIEIEEV